MTRVAGRYELGAMLGSGGFATVYRAHDPLEDRDVAVKVIPSSLWKPAGGTRAGDAGHDGLRESESLDRFRHEALALSRLRSRHVARVYDFGRDDAVGLYLVMELIEGVPLDVRSVGRALLPHEVLRVARGLLGGLADAHAAGIVHRDVKPSNVLVPRGKTALDEPRLLDFGIARDERRAQLDEEARWPLEPRKGVVLGTPAYMAPEQLLQGLVGPPADVYAAALVLFELLDVGPLFPGETTRDQMRARLSGAPSLEARVPPPLSTLLARMLAPDPAARFRDAGQALDAIGDLETAPVTVALLFPEGVFPEGVFPQGVFPEGVFPDGVLAEGAAAPEAGSSPRSAGRAASSSAPPGPSSSAWGPRPSYHPEAAPSTRPSGAVADSARRLSLLDKDPVVALIETLKALDLPMLDALARRERGSTFARVARGIALALRLELDAAALVLEPLAESDLARAFGAMLVAPRARRVTRARVEIDRADAWIDTLDPELVAMLVALGTALTLRDDAARNEARCRRAADRLAAAREGPRGAHDPVVAPAAHASAADLSSLATSTPLTTARMAETTAKMIAGHIATSQAIAELLSLRDADPSPPSPFHVLVRALLFGVAAFRGDEHLAREQLERATKLAAETSITLLETRAMVGWGGMLVEIPERVPQGLGLLQRAATLLAHGDAPSLEHIAEHNRGAALVIQGRYAEAAPHARRAREAARGELTVEHEILSCMNEGFAHVCLGARDAAAAVVREMSQARLAMCSPRTAAYARIVRSMFAMLFQSAELARSELRAAHASAAAAEAEGADAYLFAEALGILYASARHEDIDLLTRAGELEKLAQDHGFVSFYWFDVLRAMVAQIKDLALRAAVGDTLERLAVLPRLGGASPALALSAAAAARHSSIPDRAEFPLPGRNPCGKVRRMGAKEHSGLVGYDSFHFVVENFDRSRAFYTEKFDFKEVARAGDELVQRSGQQSVVFGAGDVRVCVSTPLRQTSKAARYLTKHPAGVMSLSFRVQDLDQTIAFLDKRGGTFLSDPIEDKDSRGGRYRSVEIATPLGDVAFRFVERNDYRAFAPGFTDSGAALSGGSSALRPDNVYGITSIDHITSNGLTMQPIVAWYRDVLGLEPFWEISFHTQDVVKNLASGSGLRSIVMWDPESGVKFATNEPLRPHYRDSQIAKFCEDNSGNGVQHIAMAVNNILWSVEELHRRGVDFMETHPAYYRDLPGRLAELGITNVKEELKELERLQILLDGANDKYMLQIFMREAKALYDEGRAGPFFYEIIQRAGDPGFGYGNFRALFESIERAQRTAPAANLSTMSAVSEVKP